jgi:hypothetical protein
MGLAIALTFSFSLLAFWAIPQAISDMRESNLLPSKKGA